MGRIKQSCKKVFRDIGVTLGCLLAATLLSYLIGMTGESDAFSPLLYELAILVIARTTSGYIYGIAASFIGMFGVNFVFTYPYYAIDFTLEGYPETFLCFLAVAVFISALTTRLKDQERQRSESEKEIVRANLLRSISHDFRTPLTTIIGTANAMLDRSVIISDSERTQMLQTVADEAEWLKRIVENLMSITRVNGDAGNIKKTSEMAEEILFEAAAKFRRQGLPVEVVIDSPQEILFVPMDTMLICQVLQNLLDNAVRHGKKTTRIALSVHREGNNAVFSVRDNGIGVEPSKLSLLQSGKPIPTPRDSSADHTRNMGIGLSVCHTIISAHGGAVTFANNKEGGASVRFTLPLDEENT